MPKPFIIGVSGGTASGKKSICNAILSSLTSESYVILRMNSFVKEKSASSSLKMQFHNQPHALSFVELHQTLENLLEDSTFISEGELRDDSLSRKMKNTPAKIIIVEGDLVFFDESIRNLLDLKIFVHTDDDERLARKVLSMARGKEDKIPEIIDCYRKFDKPAYYEYVAPTIKYADIIIPKGAENKAATDLIGGYLYRKVNEKKTSN